MILNLNRSTLSLDPVNGIINAAIERAASNAAELPRLYLGASIIGYECARPNCAGDPHGRRARADPWLSGDSG